MEDYLIVVCVCLMAELIRSEEGFCESLKLTLILFFLDMSLTLSDPTEKVSLQIMSKRPIVEGDNVTLKCHADGNPPPSSFFFHIKVSQSPDLSLKEHR